MSNYSQISTATPESNYSQIQIRTHTNSRRERRSTEYFEDKDNMKECYFCHFQIPKYKPTFVCHNKQEVNKVSMQGV